MVCSLFQRLFAFEFKGWMNYKTDSSSRSLWAVSGLDTLSIWKMEIKECGVGGLLVNGKRLQWGKFMVIRFTFFLFTFYYLVNFIHSLDLGVFLYFFGNFYLICLLGFYVFPVGVIAYYTVFYEDIMIWMRLCVDWIGGLAFLFEAIFLC